MGKVTNMGMEEKKKFGVLALFGTLMIMGIRYTLTYYQFAEEIWFRYILLLLTLWPLFATSKLYLQFLGINISLGLLGECKFDGRKKEKIADVGMRNQIETRIWVIYGLSILSSVLLLYYLFIEPQIL